jgi:fumarate hydratase subunit beta
MDPYTLPLLEAGPKGAIGKGGCGPEVREAFVNHRAVYFLAVGGAAALLSKHIVRSDVVAYANLGIEAIRLMEFDAFPVVVCNDAHDGDALEVGKAQWRRVEAS